MARDYTHSELVKRLTPDSELHRRLSEAIMSRLKMSSDKMGERYSAFAESEKQFAAYVPAGDVDKARKAKKNADPTSQDYVTIEMPYSYAVAMTVHTYITGVFLSRSPIYQFQGRHGETEDQIMALEALMDYQCVAGEHVATLFTTLFDPLQYGFSVTGQYWADEKTQVRRYVEEQPTFLGIPIPGKAPIKVPVVEEVPAYKGNRLFNVRVQDFFPDVRKALSDFQKGEFCGRYFEEAWQNLREDSDGYFNLKAAYDSSYGNSEMIRRDLGASAVITLPGTNRPDFSRTKPDDLFKGYEFEWKLVPSDYGLGANNKSELWVFTVSRAGTIIGARPAGRYHGTFNYDVTMYEPNGYTLFPTSAMERIEPLNNVLSWLVNSHFYNVRAALNNNFIVDPMKVVMKDVLSRKAGQVIRLKPEAYGSDVRTAISQLPVSDVTRGNLSDAQLVESMIQRTLGATDNVMGMPTQGGRKTATEVRSSNGFSTNRLKTLCEMASAYGIGPMAKRLVSNTQQFYDSNTKYKLVGDLAQFAPGALEVSPEKIAGFYDFVPIDGTLPADRYAQAQLWQSLLQGMQQHPQILQSYDMPKLFSWIATLAGLRNVQRFRINVMPPGQVDRQLAAGNMVPAADAMRDLDAVGEPNRIEGMGATG